MWNRKTTQSIAHYAAMILFLMVVEPVQSEEDPSHRKEWQRRWVRLNTNMLVEKNAENAYRIVERAAAAGYNGVVLADTKSTSFFHPDNKMPRWEKNVRLLRQKARNLGMEFHIQVMSYGYGAALIHDPNLATGYPIRKAEMVAKDGQLVPISSVSVSNGSFEEFKKDRISGWFQDDPGKGSFVDHEVVQHGKFSLRFEGMKDANDHGHARVNQTLAVQPFQQYRIRVWMKCEDLSGWFAFMAKSNDGSRNMQTLSKTFSHHTADWTEYVTTINTVDQSEIKLYAGIWGGTSGRFWIDNVSIEPVPTLNLLRRSSLPLEVVGKEGQAFEEGRDFLPMKDPKLGRYRWAGDFGNTHQPPTIKLTTNTRIDDGQTVLLSCYHAFAMPERQRTSSMAEPKVYEIGAEQVRRLSELVDPDGYFLGHDEIRTGGWEPEATRRFKTTGELFAYNIKRCYEITNTKGGGKPVFVWSDMFQPHHNARENYYMVNNTIAGSWEGLHKDLIIVSWLAKRDSLTFMADRGQRQMVAGYYDEDVSKNYEDWMKASHGIDGILGTVYCTWSNQWDDLERYAEVWWGGNP